MIDRRHRLPAWGLLLALFTLTSTAAVAQDVSSPPKSVHEQMITLSDEGYDAFFDGRFAEAAAKFSLAYNLESNPTLLKNEAIAWLKAGDPVAAVDAANRFLIRDDTDEGDVWEVRQVWANAKLAIADDALKQGADEIAEQLLDEVEEANPNVVVRDRAMQLRIELARSRSVPATRRPSAPTLSIPPPESDRVAVDRRGAPVPRLSRRQIGMGLTSIGGATLVSSFVYHLVALGWQRRFYEIADNGGDVEEFERLRSRVSTARVAVPVLYGLGALTSGAGIWLIVRPSMDPRATAVRGVHIGFGWSGNLP